MFYGGNFRFFASEIMPEEKEISIDNQEDLLSPRRTRPTCFRGSFLSEPGYLGFQDGRIVFAEICNLLASSCAEKATADTSGCV